MLCINITLTKIFDCKFEKHLDAFSDSRNNNTEKGWRRVDLERSSVCMKYYFSLLKGVTKVVDLSAYFALVGKEKKPSKTSESAWKNFKVRKVQMVFTCSQPEIY